KEMSPEVSERAHVLYEHLLKLLHPFMPFITEEVWQRIRDRKDNQALIVSEWPKAIPSLDFSEEESLFGTIQQMISSIRNIRAEMNVPDATQIPVIIKPAEQPLEDAFKQHSSIFSKLLKIDSFTVDSHAKRPKASASAVVNGHQLFVPLSGLIDFEKEKIRIEKEIERLTSFLNGVEKKLANSKFVENAPAEVVEKEQKKKRDTTVNLEKMQAILKDLV
ncbi:class I tRNA ligase family protein, partial [Balneolaceae bacterium ANBcel3]|nr:class I tRNA ligase family protein [Balneolaceae bacterium ANBcel3]